MATYPIALLSYQGQQGKTISQVRERRHPITKKTIKAIWKVLGSEEYGLPTANDDAVVMVLLELSREKRFPREVTFSRYDLVRRLGWPDNAASYTKLKLAFSRLNALTIQSENVFWDEKARSFCITGFHLIEEFKLVTKAGRSKADDQDSLSWFRWGEPLWFSFRDGNLKPISLDVYFSLNLPTARRLYRFLDLVRYDGKPRYRIGLRKLCEEYLALASQRYLSKYKENLAPSHEELIRIGYLRRVSYEEAKDGGENVIYEFEPLRAFESACAPLPAKAGGGQGGKDSPASTCGLSQATPDGATEAVPPHSLAVALSLAHGDPEAWDAAAADVLERLGEAEQERLRESVVTTLPPFLREEMGSGVAQQLIENGMLKRVREAHDADVAQELERRVKVEVEARQAGAPEAGGAGSAGLHEVSDDA